MDLCGPSDVSLFFVVNFQAYLALENTCTHTSLCGNIYYSDQRSGVPTFALSINIVKFIQNNPIICLLQSITPLVH